MWESYGSTKEPHAVKACSCAGSSDVVKAYPRAGTLARREDMGLRFHSVIRNKKEGIENSGRVKNARSRKFGGGEGKKLEKGAYKVSCVCRRVELGGAGAGVDTAIGGDAKV